MENILFNADRVWLAESADNGNLRARFVLCDFGVNLNGVRLNRNTINNWMSTIVNQPLVGKIVRGMLGEKEDFAGHEMRRTYVKDDTGNMRQVVSFDTNAYGTFTDIAIEDVDGTECLVATAEIWDRYPKTVQLIKDRIAAGTLHTSWEITVYSYTIDESGVKVIDDGVFTALAMLGSRVQPAYDSSRLLEVAEADADDELISAMEQDMKENDMKKDENPDVETAESTTPEIETEAEQSAETTPDAAEIAEETPAEPEAEDTSVAETEEASDEPEQASEVEAAALTTGDLYRLVSDAVMDKLKEWAHVAFLFPEEHTAWVKAECCPAELDYILFVYEVEGDRVTIDDGTPVQLTVSVASVNETMAQKDAAIAAAASEIAELKTQIASLETIKAEYDKIMAKKAEDELAEKQAALLAYAKKSGMFTDGELAKGNVKKLIDALDKAGVDQMIAARYMAQLEKQPEKSVVTSEATHQDTYAADLTADAPQRKSVVRAYYEN